MLNNVTLVGRITKDPDLRKTPTGVSVVSFTLAVNRRFGNNQEGGQQADFISCVAWRHSADFLVNYVKQGALLGIEGRIETRNYKDQNDRTVYVTEVICDSVQLLHQKKEQEHGHEHVQDYGHEYGQSVETTLANGTTLDISADDLPF